VVLVTTFFVTSCDSGTLVIASVLSYGVTEPPKAMRFVWGVSEGLLAAVLLAMGGLAALQTAVLVAGLPVAALLLVIIAGLMSALRTETVGPRPEVAPLWWTVSGFRMDLRVGKPPLVVDR
jgi:choline/glycine/proline betaine transport protein